MNRRQKQILIVVAAVIGLMLLFPPYEKWSPFRHFVDTGFAWLFDLPQDSRVNTVQILVQWLGVLLVGCVLFFIVKD